MSARLTIHSNPMETKWNEGLVTQRLLVDFDNTMGIPGRDVDDLMALLFLLGSDDILIEGVTTTFGNSSLETVHTNTTETFERLGIGIPVFAGAVTPSTFRKSDDEPSDAARFLAESVAASPGEISVLALGSLTNLRDASTLEPSFFSHLEGIHLMGGTTEPLDFSGVTMDELNLSSDVQAARSVLSAPCPVMVATAQSCLPAFFPVRFFEERLARFEWVSEVVRSWCAKLYQVYGMEGFICWDVVAAAAVVRPELFEKRLCEVSLHDRYLTNGMLVPSERDDPVTEVLVLGIRDPGIFVEVCLDAWELALDRAASSAPIA